MLTSCVSLCSLLELNTSIFHQTIFTTYYPTVVTMGNTNGGGGGGFRQETIKSASYHTRSLNSSGSSNSGPGSHHGVVVNTNQGNSYLIHHPGPSGRTTVTQASNMSKNWKKSHDIAVCKTTTVQEVFNGAGGRTKNPVLNYATAKTCIGAAKGAENVLQKGCAAAAKAPTNPPK